MVSERGNSQGKPKKNHSDADDADNTDFLFILNPHCPRLKNHSGKPACSAPFARHLQPPRQTFAPVPTEACACPDKDLWLRRQRPAPVGHRIFLRKKPRPATAALSPSDSARTPVDGCAAPDCRAYRRATRGTSVGKSRHPRRNARWYSES